MLTLQKSTTSSVWNNESKCHFHPPPRCHFPEFTVLSTFSDLFLSKSNQSKKQGFWQVSVHCVHSSSVHNIQKVGATWGSTDRRMGKHRGPSMQGSVIQLQRGRTFWHLLPHDEPWGHYAQWHEPVTKGQRLYDPTSMRSLKRSEY